MSADDWLNCPVCQGLRGKLKNGYKQYYGKVPENEYNQLRAEYEKAIQKKPVRVDYEYDLNADMTISLNMHARCDLCNAEWEHTGVVR